MNNFRIFLGKVSERPALYVGECSLKAVSYLLDGYCTALEDSGCSEQEMKGWMRWTEARFLISSSAWGWTRILLHVYGSDRAALDALPSLYDEFLAQRSAIGVEGIEAARQQRLLAAYGEDDHVPEVTNTPDPSWGLP